MISGAMCDKSVLAAIMFLNAKIKFTYSMYRDEIFISKTYMVLMEACWKVEQCVLCSSLTANISICLPDFRNSLYGLVCFSNALNTHCTTAYNSTCSLLNIIPSKNFVLLPPLWQLINCILYSSLLRRHSVSETAVMGCLQIQPASLQRFLDVRKQKEIIRSKGWTVCRMCRDFPVPVLLQTVDVMQ